MRGSLVTSHRIAVLPFTLAKDQGAPRPQRLVRSLVMGSYGLKGYLGVDYAFVLNGHSIHICGAARLDCLEGGLATHIDSLERLSGAQCVLG